MLWDHIEECGAVSIGVVDDKNESTKATKVVEIVDTSGHGCVRTGSHNDSIHSMVGRNPSVTFVVGSQEKGIEQRLVVGW